MPSARLNTALAGLVVSATLAAPAAYALPTDPAAPAVTRTASDVPPPPSSIAASAGQEYEELRARNTVASQPVADEPSAPGGFDWVSAAIGAVAAAGVAVVSMAALGVRKPPACRGHVSSMSTRGLRSAGPAAGAHRLRRRLGGRHDEPGSGFGAPHPRRRNTNTRRTRRPTRANHGGGSPS